MYPVTVKPYAFWDNGGSTSQNPWALQGQYQFQGDYDKDSGQTRDMYGYFDAPDYDPNWMRSLGYNGSPGGFENWARTQGLTLGQGQMKGGGASGQDLLRLQAFRNGTPVGGEHRWTKDENNPGFEGAMALMSLFMGNAAGLGGLAGSAGDAVSGMDLAGDAAAGMGNNIGTAAGSFGSSPVGFSMAGANGQLLDPSAYQGITSNAMSPVQPGEYGELGSGGGITPGSYADPYAGMQATGGAELGSPGGFTPGSYSDPYASMPTTGVGGGSTPTLSQLLSGASTAKGFLPVGAALAGAGAAMANNNGGQIGIPDYMGAANSAALSGRTNQTNPYGSLTYTQTGVDAKGNPVYSQNVALNPQGQANLTSAQQAQGTALGGWNDVLSSMGTDWSKIPGVYGDAGSQENLVNQARDAMYSQQTRYLDPQYKQLQDQYSSQLANQGITLGSQAYTTAMDNFARQRDSAYGNARDSSINQGNQFANQLFGQNLQAHNSGVNDWMTHLQGAGGAASTAANNANSFNPTFAGTPAPTNFLGAAALQGQGNLNQYNATTGAQNSFNNGLFNLGGSILSNPSWTDMIGKFFSGGGGG